MPPQPLRDIVATPSPTWPRSPPADTTPPQLRQPDVATALANGVAGHEASLVQARQSRGTRLSFLGGRKKEVSPQRQANGGGDPEPPQSRSQSRDNPNRLSFFRAHSSDSKPPQTNGSHETSAGSDWSTDPGQRDSIEVGSLDKDRVVASEGGGVAKRGSVRKRLSLLKLGRKASKGNDLMGAVDEE